MAPALMRPRPGASSPIALLMLMVLVSVVMVRVAPVMVQAPVWKVRLPVSTVLVPSVTLPLRSTGTLRVRAVLLLPESLPLTRVSLPVPSAELLPTRKTPALRAVPPLYVFAPVKVAIPVVVLLALAAPAMTVVPIVLLARRSIRVLTVNGPTPVIALPLLVTISVSIVSAKPPVARSPPLRVTAQVSGITPAAPRVRIPLLTVIGPAQLLLVFERVNVELSMVRRPDPVLVMGLSALIDGGGFAKVYLANAPITAELINSSDFQSAMWVATVLYLPLSMLFWHAPALVHWHGVPPLKSLFFSWVACWRNLGAFSVYLLAWAGVFMSGVAVVLAISSALGGADMVAASLVPGALLMAAMFFTSIYFSVRDCFDLPVPGAQTQA